VPFRWPGIVTRQALNDQDTAEPGHAPKVQTQKAALYTRLRDGLLRRRRPEATVQRAFPGWMKTERRTSHVTSGQLISVIMPAYRTPHDLLLAAITSVRTQSYRSWELCVAHDGSASMQVLAVNAAMDRRIRPIRQTANGGIAAATNDALSIATGEFVAFLDHDDQLAPQALARIAAELAAYPQTDLIFSDEDQLLHKEEDLLTDDGTPEDGSRSMPYFKPGWNPDLMLGQNLICHLAVYRRSLIQTLGGFRPDFDGSQDYDLALRAIANGARIRHIPEILYHWRKTDFSFSLHRAEACEHAARRALAEHLGQAGTPVPHQAAPQWTRVAFPLPPDRPKLSLILPPGSTAPDDPDYPGVEILHGEPNAMADAATGHILVFLGRGLGPATPGWLAELAAQALRPEIACVGGRIDSPTGRILQSGLTLHPEHIALTLHPGSDAADPGYRGQFLLPRTVSAVSAQCLAIRRDHFLAAGGFTAELGPYADVDLCLRMAQKNLRCVWTPHARLQGRIAPIKPAPAAAALMRARWGALLAADPYFNPNLAITAGTLTLATRPP
jgi:GT2 family glycosyltransferase